MDYCGLYCRDRHSKDGKTDISIFSKLCPGVPKFNQK